MINVGILGASTPQGGELVRILVNHPDVELAFAYDTANVGMPLTALHHGLIGETSLAVTDTPSLARLDAVIICAPSELARKIALNPELYPRMKVIDMTGEYGTAAEAAMTLGLSEVNRKPLVRGATRAVIPSPAVTAMAVALYPFASSLLLGADIDVILSGRTGGDCEADASAITGYLAGVQNSFSSKVNISVDASKDEGGSGRGLRAVITFPCSLRLEDAAALYDPVYDDHNFTFISTVPVTTAEVEGTQKCIITPGKPDDAHLRLDVVVDGTLRGGAGDAVHVLNLLFALHERTGLALKAINF